MLNVIPSMGWSQWRNNTTFDERYSEILYWIERELRDIAEKSNDWNDIKVWEEFNLTSKLPSSPFYVGVFAGVVDNLDLISLGGYGVISAYKNRIFME